MAIRKYALPLLAAAVLLCLFMLLAIYYESAFLRKYDLMLVHAASRLQTPFLDDVFILISNSASRPSEFFLLAVFSLWCVIVKKRVAEPILLAASLIGVRYMNSWLKSVFERDRPAFQPVIEAPGFSFPSGHAMISLAFFFLLFIILSRVIGASRSKTKIILIVTGVFVFLVGFSRVYLGVHYPSDILAGFSAGLLWLMLSLALYKLIPHSKSPDHLKRR
ncbi:phosphatase PAP2 family protein [Fictibacillus aquaticus]|uniref:phosphatase PAP2 family protein n=1 Tax=Fictibacillus aquaticus TaxID=2021314 RepID=UPI0013FD3C83|nr:phosphatase PAP2 family protein [Fictibacillus aquaticus]